MSEFVRVKMPNGKEASVSASFAKSRGLKPLPKPAAKNGRALRDKPRSAVLTPSGSTTTANPSGSDKAASTQEESK